MYNNAPASISQMNEEQLVWEIEIKDLGACKPFLGFSLTDQYLLVGVTSPDQQNEVSITSIPKEEDQRIRIPLSLNKFDFPRSGILRFKGIQFLIDRWEFLLHNFHTDRTIKLNANSKLSLSKIFQKNSSPESGNTDLNLILERRK